VRRTRATLASAVAVLAAAARGATVAAVVLVALGLVVSCAGCTAADEADLKPPPGYVAPPFRPLRGPIARSTVVRYGEGFYGVESSPAGMTWRWAARRGTVHLPNDRHDKQLRINGWVPLELLGEAPTVRIALGGRELDRFVANPSHFNRDYAVSAAQLGAAAAAELTIETSATVHAPGDARELGVSVAALDWRDAPPAAAATP
jgi:hypothetical protein